jgi:integrase
MGLYKREKTWHFSHVINYPDGKRERIRQSMNTSNKGIAERNYRGFLNSIEDGSYFKKAVSIPQMKEVVERYMKEVSPLQKSHNRNKEIYLHWIYYFGDLLASEVTTSLLSSYKAKRLTGELRFGKNEDPAKRRKAGQSTIKKELAFLRMIFNKAIDEWDDDWDEYFKHNPVNPVRKVIKGLKENKRVRYVMPDEAQKLKLTIPRWLKPIVMVGCHTGLRASNIIELMVSQIDFERGLIAIRSEDMKDGEPLTVKMTSIVRDVLLSVIKSRKTKSPYVFIDEDGNPYSRNAVSMAFKRACDRAEVKDLHFHDLRHDFATLLIENHVDLYRVQHLLGHSDPRMTQRYAHLLPGTFNAIDAIEGKGFVTILSQEG